MSETARILKAFKKGMKKDRINDMCTLVDVIREFPDEDVPGSVLATVYLESDKPLKWFIKRLVKLHVLEYSTEHGRISEVKLTYSFNNFDKHSRKAKDHE